MSATTKDVQMSHATKLNKPNNNVEVVEVATKKDLWKWVRFPNEL